MEVELGSEAAAKAAKSFINWPGTWPIEYFPYLKRGTKALSPIGGQEFKLVGFGTSRIALLGPDGVIYKVPRGCPCSDMLCSTLRQNHEEIALFRLAEQLGYSWTPDFFYYGRPVDVMTMRRYNLETKGLCNQLEITNPEIIQEIGQYTSDYDDFNFGLRADGSVVLIDGGRSTVFPDIKKKKCAAFSPGALVS